MRRVGGEREPRVVGKDRRETEEGTKRGASELGLIAVLALRTARTNKMQGVHGAHLSSDAIQRILDENQQLILAVMSAFSSLSLQGMGAGRGRKRDRQGKGGREKRDGGRAKRLLFSLTALHF
eukprot:2945245-Rhodomonas_salina.1